MYHAGVIKVPTARFHQPELREVFKDQVLRKGAFVEVPQVQIIGIINREAYGAVLRGAAAHLKGAGSSR